MQVNSYEKVCPACNGRFPFCNGCNHRGSVLTSEATMLIAFLSRYFDIKPKGELVNNGDNLTSALSKMIVDEPKLAVVEDLIESMPLSGSQGNAQGRPRGLTKKQVIALIDGKIAQLAENGVTVTEEVRNQALTVCGA